MQVPNSSGTARPKLTAPDNSCDCHMHIYDGERFPPSRPESRMQPNADVPDYRLLQQRIGTRRVIVVTPAAYLTDNAVTLDAIAQLGPAARGVGVVHPIVTDAELKRMADGGVRGIRFTQFDPKTATTSLDMIEPLARRVQALGWHVQIYLRADQIVAAEELLLGLPGTVVFDHLGRLTPPEGLESLRHWHHSPDARRRPHLDEAVGCVFLRRPTGLCRSGEVARAYISAAPERMVWGSDWPHPTEKEKPDDAVLFDLLSEWAPVMPPSPHPGRIRRSYGLRG